MGENHLKCKYLKLINLEQVMQVQTREDFQFHLEDLFQQQVAALGLTQAQAAEKCGTHQQVISDIKNHRQGKTVSGWTLIRFLERLGARVEVEIRPRGGVS